MLYTMMILLRLLTTIILLAAIILMYKSIKPLSEGHIKDIFRSIFYFTIFILFLQMVMILMSNITLDEYILVLSLIMSVLALSLMIISATRIKFISELFGFEKDMK